MTDFDEFSMILTIPETQIRRSQTLPEGPTDLDRLGAEKTTNPLAKSPARPQGGSRRVKFRSSEVDFVELADPEIWISEIFLDLDRFWTKN